MTYRRTLFVGLDAACWEYYQPLLDEGQLPALQGLIQRGVRGSLRSTTPAWTPTAWASISTGKNPGKHGVYDMFWLSQESYDFYPSSARSRFGTPFWTRLNQAGLRVGLVNIPFTYPPDSVGGFIVTGFGAPSDQPEFAYPAAARDWILEHYPDFKPWVAFGDREDRRPGIMAVTDQQQQETQVSIALALAEKYVVDVLAINLMAVDHANHWFPGMKGVRNSMIATDRDLQRLLDGFEPENVVLFSDHGSRRVEGDFFLDRWLHDNGFLALKPRSAKSKKAFLNILLSRHLRNRLKVPAFIETPLRKLFLAFFPLFSGERLARLVEITGARIPFAPSMFEWDGLDTERSPWLLGSPRSGLLYVNLKGRRPAGVVASEDRARVVEELAARLAELKDPDGEPVFSSIRTPEEIYHGPAAAFAPDLIVESLENAWPAVANLNRGLFRQASVDDYFVRLGKIGDHGQHSRNGLFVFAGKDFTEGECSRVGEMQDLPATLLHLYDIPIPEDWDGEVITETLAGPAAQNPVRQQPGDLDGTPDYRGIYSQQEDEEIFTRLKDLGYM